ADTSIKFQQSYIHEWLHINRFNSFNHLLIYSRAYYDPDHRQAVIQGETASHNLPILVCDLIFDELSVIVSTPMHKHSYIYLCNYVINEDIIPDCVSIGEQNETSSMNAVQIQNMTVGRGKQSQLLLPFLNRFERTEPAATLTNQSSYLKRSTVCPACTSS